jgi:hypothetical protein
MLQHLKAGKPLKMLMSSWSCQQQSVGGQATFDIQSQRSFNSVRAVLINGWRSVTAAPYNWPRTRLFLGPMTAASPNTLVTISDTNDTAELQLQLGTWKWPTTPAKGVTELIMMTRKATGSLSGPLVGIYNSNKWHLHDCNIMFDLEKLSRHGENLTGIRSNAGSIMTVSVKNWGIAGDSRPTEAWICLHVDQIVTFFGDSVDVAV